MNNIKAADQIFQTRGPMHEFVLKTVKQYRDVKHKINCKGSSISVRCH